MLLIRQTCNTLLSSLHALHGLHKNPQGHVEMRARHRGDHSVCTAQTAMKAARGRQPFAAAPQKLFSVPAASSVPTDMADMWVPNEGIAGARTAHRW